MAIFDDEIFGFLKTSSSVSFFVNNLVAAEWGRIFHGRKGLLVCSVTHYYIDVSEKCVEMCGRSGGVWGDDGAIIDETLLIDNSADVTPAREKKEGDCRLVIRR